ncbi:MAG TPA: DUF4337 domain-containing protein [Terriglobia bacterium]|nr:DUF4337 domain-containing protein [Terriglobia bacterium]
MSEELHELHEHAEEAHHDASLVPVTVTMAILAVLVAAVSLLGHRAHTEELLNQSRASDHWAEYQAKNIRRHTYELFLDLMSTFDTKNNEQAQKVREKYQREIERYGGQQEEIQSEAREYEKEVALAARRANRFDLGEVLLEASLVIASMTLITRRRIFWKLGIVFAAVGLLVASTGLFVH